MHRPPPEKGNAVQPGEGDGASRDRTESGSGKQRYKVTPPHAQALHTVATVAKSHCSQLRVALSEWRGRHSIELRECTASIPGCFWPTSAGVNLDVSLVPQLLEAIIAVEREAIVRGLLPGRAAA